MRRELFRKAPFRLAGGGGEGAVPLVLRALFGACVGAVLASAPGAARAQSTTAQVAEASASADRSPQSATERRELFARMMADPADLDTAFRYARLSVEAGDVEAAIATLERMLIFAPGLPRLQLELGVLYYRLGALDTARSYFEAATGSPDIPPDVRDRVEPFLAAIDEQARPEAWSGAVLLGARGQTNANAAPEARTVNLNGIDFLLNDAAVRAGDANGFVSASLLYRHDLPGQGDRFEASLQTYGALYAERNELDTILGELTAGPVFDLERFRLDGAFLGVYAILGGVMLKSDPYLASGGIGTSFAKTLGADTDASVRVEYRRETFRDSFLRPTASSRDGDRYSVIGTMERRVTAAFSVFAIGNAERRQADAGFLSLWEGGLVLGATQRFRPFFAWNDVSWAATLSGGYARRDYDDPDPVIDRFAAQRDDEYFAQASLAVPLDTDWSLQTVVGYRDVASNYDLRTFSNVSVSLGLLRRF